MSVGLALSGGGAKGAAHIGVLQALKEEGINFSYISGTSSGSIIATLYAVGYNPYNILHMFKLYCNQIADYDKMLPFKLFGTLFTGKINIKGLAKGDKLEDTIRSFCLSKNVKDIADIKFNIAIPTVDLNTGEIIYYLNSRLKNNIRDIAQIDDTPSFVYSGDIASIVRASCGFPVVFEPKKINDKLLIDGGVRINTPVNILKEMGAKKIIAVKFNKEDKCGTYGRNIVSIALRSFDIMGHQINKEEIKEADYVIDINTKNIGLLDGSNTNLLATAGYNLVKKNINKIKEVISS